MNGKPDSRAAKPTPQSRWRQRNPLAHWAHSALRSGLKRGLVEPKPCEVCGDPKAEAHHPSYDRPLAVLWVCRPCHKRLHTKRRAKA